MVAFYRFFSWFAKINDRKGYPSYKLTPIFRNSTHHVQYSNTGIKDFTKAIRIKNDDSWNTIFNLKLVNKKKEDGDLQILYHQTKSMYQLAFQNLLKVSILI